VTAQYKPRRHLAQKAIPPLILSALGTVGVVGLYFLVPGLQPIDIVLLLVVVGFSAVGYTQGILHGIMTIVMLYVATGVAATFYRMVTPYVGTIQWLLELPFTRNLDTSPSVDYDTLALSFGLLAVIAWGALEVISRASFRDTSLPRLGMLDNLGGILTYLVVGILVASLLFNAIGYGQQRHVHDRALLRPGFNQVLYLHYTAQWFWFPRRPPPIYVYDLDLPREH